MARITVEDCIDKFPSRFELVLVASNRARKLHAGESPSVEIDNDKNTVIALREIAEETLSKDQLKNDLVEEYQSNTLIEDEEINELEDNSNEDASLVNETIPQDTQNESSIEDTNDTQIIQKDDQTQDDDTIETSEDNLENLSDEDKPGIL